MNNEIYIITGASDGLGKQLALSLIKDGKAVVCLSRSKPDYDGVEWIQTDLTDRKSLDDASAKLNYDKRKISALINNAGVMSAKKFDQPDLEDITNMMDVNISGHIYLTSKLGVKLNSDESDIVNISSTVGTKGVKDQQAYTASKWAVRGFSESLREQFKDTKLRVISFCTGGMNNSMGEKVGIPMLDPQNWMNPKDVAEFLKAILYLPKSMEVSDVVINRKKKI
ncbi:MAG TPA: SDR family oxidoreductase [Candidatus Saccharibacteria bacterium]|nr:SDR family oxidoreductase [Candidatus Saccharibacteria bacterium]